MLNLEKIEAEFEVYELSRLHLTTDQLNLKSAD